MIVRYLPVILRACEGTELGDNIAIIGLVSRYVVLIEFNLGRYNFTIRIKKKLFCPEKTIDEHCLV